MLYNRTTITSWRKFMARKKAAPERKDVVEKKEVKSTANPVDKTLISIDEITGDNVLEKITDNEVARKNREVAALGRKTK